MSNSEKCSAQIVNRRSLLISGLAALASPSAHAYERCQQYFNGASCEVGFPLERFDSVYAAQRGPVWCSAATLEMLFRVYGYHLSQETIVQTAYGRLVNLPAYDTSQIVSLTSRNWVDDNGVKFRSRLVAAYDARYQHASINNAMIIDALRNEEPLVYCNKSHMMLLTAIAYNPTPAGPNIYNLGFFDPYPGRGARGPDRPSELHITHLGGEIMFIGQVKVS